MKSLILISIAILFVSLPYLVERAVLKSYLIDPVKNDFITNGVNFDKNLRISDMNRVTKNSSLNGDYLSKVVRISTRPNCEKINFEKMVCGYDIYRSDFISLFKDDVQFCLIGLDMCNELFRGNSIGRLIVEYHGESRSFTLLLKDMPFSKQVIIDYLNFYMASRYDFKMVNKNEMKFDLNIHYRNNNGYPEIIKIRNKMDNLVEIYVHFK